MSGSTIVLMLVIRAPHRAPRLPKALLAALALLVSALPARAVLVDKCRWPPPGGPAVRPDSTDVMMNPVVADLDGDGRPEIVFISFPDSGSVNAGYNGILRIIHGGDCSDVTTVTDVGCVTCFGESSCHSLDEQNGPGFLDPPGGLAVADLDGDGKLEIIGVTEGDGGDPIDHRRLVIFDCHGNFLRCSAASAVRIGYLAAPAVADLDGDGHVEIAVSSTVYEADDASIRFALPQTGMGLTAIADVDGDGVMDVIAGERALRADGSVIWHRPDLGLAIAAVGDFDHDCKPDVVEVSWHHASISILDGATGATRCTALLPGGLDDCPTPRPGQGGAPTLADIDGDCVPEIGVAGCLHYSLWKYSPDPSGGTSCLNLLWAADTQDISSRVTSSTIFDLDGDGRFEVLYNDEHVLRRYDALTGAVIDALPNSTHTLTEYPTVADVDGDGHAEVVVCSNKYAICCDSGLRVITDDAEAWVPTRAIHNEHSYHVTNVTDSGRIPRFEEPSWSRYNGYRAQQGPTSCDRGGCGLEPACAVSADANPLECRGPRSSLQLHGTITSPPAAGPMTFRWSTDCPNGSLDDPTSLDPVLTFDGPPPCPRTCTATLTVTSGWGAVSSCTLSVSVTDSLPPALLGVPGDATVECDAVPAAPTVRATDACDPNPRVDFSETRANGSCAQSYSLTRRWTATDACGNSTSATQVVTVRDTHAPSMSGVPGNATVECDAVPAAPTVRATDNCDPNPRVDFNETRANGSCAQNYVLTRRWTATDACGNSTSATQVVTVRDTHAPSMSGVPGNATVECDAVPAAPTVRATDACDPNPRVDFSETRANGSCAQNYVLTRRWTATDACGNSTSATQVVTVRDTHAPSVAGVPSDVTVECDAVPPPPTVSATDNCDPNPRVNFAEARTDGPCANDYVLRRQWTATDACGNSTTRAQVVTVVDTTPPVVTASTDVFACLWPPNHWYVCLDASQWNVQARDNCPGAVTWRVVGCASDQPDDANGVGDGETTNDCIVIPDGSGVCARAERDGTVPSGRHYGIAVVAVDACGNASAPTVVGTLYVPHDQDPHEKSCLNPTKVGCRPNQPVPCP